MTKEPECPEYDDHLWHERSEVNDVAEERCARCGAGRTVMDPWNAHKISYDPPGSHRTAIDDCAESMRVAKRISAPPHRKN